MEKCPACRSRNIEVKIAIVPDDFGAYYPDVIEECQRCGYYELLDKNEDF